jgi:hypothetical protein
MGHPNSLVKLGARLTSADGKYWFRYPNGDRPIAQGAGITATATAAIAIAVGAALATAAGVTSTALASSGSASGGGSNGYAWNASGPDGVWDKIQYGIQGAHVAFVRANMWGFGQSGYNSNWTMHANAPNDWYVSADFTNGFGIPKGYPDVCRGWSRDEADTSVVLGGLGTRLDQITKWKVRASCFMNGNTTAGYRNLLLHDIYFHTSSSPASTTAALINVLYYQRSVDPRASSYFGAQCRDGFEIIVGGVSFRVSVNSVSPQYSTRADITVFNCSTYDPDGGGLPQNWGADDFTTDMKLIMDALRAHANTASLFADANAMYVTSHQVGYEPIAVPSGNTFGINGYWTAFQSEIDGGVLIPADRIISRLVPVSTTSGTSGNISDSNYNTEFRSSGGSVEVAWNLTNVPVEYRTNLLLGWIANNTYGYDHTEIGQPGYNNAGAYTIDGHTSTSSSKPTSGWVNLATVSGNTLKSLFHFLQSVSAYTWIRINFTASDGTGGNNDIGVAVDILDASSQSATTVEAVMALGDSNFANAFDWKSSDGQGDSSIGDQVAAIDGFVVPVMNAGWPGISAAAAANSKYSVISSQLTKFPGKDVLLCYGTNDGPGDSTFIANMGTIIALINSFGKRAIVCKPPQSTDGGHGHIAALASTIPTIITNASNAIAGPDFQAAGLPLELDGVHWNAVGRAAARTLVATRLAELY